MKRLFATIAALVPLFVAAPLSAHHPAADIVSDEIYDMIEENLLDADSPHLDLDLTDIMDPDGTVTGMEITVTLPRGLESQVVDDRNRFTGIQDLNNQRFPILSGKTGNFHIKGTLLHLELGSSFLGYKPF